MLTIFIKRRNHKPMITNVLIGAPHVEGYLLTMKLQCKRRSERATAAMPKLTTGHWISAPHELSHWNSIIVWMYSLFFLLMVYLQCISFKICWVSIAILAFCGWSKGTTLMSPSFHKHAGCDLSAKGSRISHWHEVVCSIQFPSRQHQ